MEDGKTAGPEAGVSSRNSEPRMEEIHNELHDVVRLTQLGHRALRGQLDTMSGGSDTVVLYEGVLALGTVVQQKLGHLIGLCREAGGL